MPSTSQTDSGTVLPAPVIIGGDIGAYSLARAFHEAYGVRSLVISRLRGWHVEDSAFIDRLLCPDPTEPAELARTLASVPERLPAQRPVLLLGSADSTVKAIIRVRDELGALPEGWTAPYVDMDAFRAGTEKQNFTALCERTGVDHPSTRVVDLAEPVEDDLEIPFTYPVIAKPAEVSEWKHADFPGRQKVHTVDSREELMELLRTIRAAGYRESMIIQDRIPGDDQSMRILTCYCDADSTVRFASYGRTLLEEHSPGAIGNPAAIITDVNPAIVEQAQRLVRELGWTGYANFDLKHDARDGRTKFFELNPRLGRSNYYVTAGGHNPVTWYVRDLLAEGLGPAGDIVQEQQRTLYTVVPVPLVRHYTTDPDAREQLRRALREGGARNPLLYRGVERSPRRWAHVIAAMANYVRKFRRYYRPAELA